MSNLENANKKTSGKLINMKKAIGIMVKTAIKDNEKDDGKMVDLEDPDKYIYKEEETIKFVRVTREEERKKKEIEIALKIKNDKVYWYLL
jgi:hypothetical protein